jgi:hypothetical protein
MPERPLLGLANVGPISLGPIPFIALVLIPPGAFEMGRRDIVLVGRITISRPFYLGKTPVTNAQYRRFLTSGYDGATRTVTRLTICTSATFAANR